MAFRHTGIAAFAAFSAAPVIVSGIATGMAPYTSPVAVVDAEVDEFAAPVVDELVAELAGVLVATVPDSEDSTGSGAVGAMELGAVIVGELAAEAGTVSEIPADVAVQAASGSTVAVSRAAICRFIASSPPRWRWRSAHRAPESRNYQHFE
jgi:hypothetical protein